MRFERRGFGGRRSFGDRDRGFGRSDIPKPVKVGEEYEVEISEVGSRGDGIARVKNFVVFINGAKQGEKTKVKITEVRNRFAIAEKVGAASAVAESASAATESASAATESASAATESASAATESASAEEAEETEEEPTAESEESEETEVETAVESEEEEK